MVCNTSPTCLNCDLHSFAKVSGIYCGCSYFDIIINFKVHT